ncbi:hypothetical protein J3R30DRAFT_3487786 [Lentinula aciculospora]|uniref:Uncharacterized protein n=1 Tax=Lentinula aciculospora TaxID=153920 RepID=A0A9W9DMG2_9AGAR|nr:hypothetical protein J3R30DRAFT_3487786 [Lentinula aciculospora]
MASTPLALIYRALVFVVICWLVLTVQADEFMQQSFSFAWDSNLAVPVPVTTQCQTLNIQWSRGTNTGPNPVAPYYLQIYTSAFVYPFIVSAGSNLNFDFAVPFGPGTLYQICMFDSQGSTGGCQAIYTVIANTSSSSLSCSNSTLAFPLGPLDVDAEVASGALSQYGWIDQCTAITVTPKNGTGPYTFTVAPTLHPPLNITSNSASSMTWTVDLTWASPFFISVADSVGNYWSYGPLHSGEGSSSCLASSSGGTISAGTVAGASVGALILGLLVGALGAFCLFRRHQAKKTVYAGLDTSSPTGSSTGYRAAPLGGRILGSTSLNRSPSGTDYQVEPFVMPEHNAGPLSPNSEGHAAHDPNSAQSRSVYVVHHDGGRAPVTVYHEDGTEVVELPPRYIDGGSTTVSGPSDARSRRSDIRSDSDSQPSAEPSADTSSRRTSDGQMPSFLQSRRNPQTTPKKAEFRLQPPT